MTKLTSWSEFDDQDISLDNALAALELLQDDRERRHSPIQVITMIRRAIANLSAQVEQAEQRADHAEQGNVRAGVVTVSMPARPETTRDVSLSPSVFVCRQCGATVEYQRYPGSFAPSMCDKPTCQEAERDRLKRANADRQKRYRDKRRAGQGEQASAATGDVTTDR